MERRNFIRTAAIGSACTIAGSLLTEKTMAKAISADHKLKITILKKTLNEEWSRQYRNSPGEVCNVFPEGKEFVVESPWMAPEGFCHWAWADIRTYIHLVNEGAFEVMIASCTDGLRPVYFKIERINL